MKNILSIKKFLNEFYEANEYTSHSLTQLYYIQYAIEEIIDCISNDCIDLPPWYVNRISKIHSDVESLHSYLEGKKRQIVGSNMNDYDLSPQFEEKLIEQIEILERREDPADRDDVATDDDRKAADKNIIVQLRRVADLPKGGDITFNDNRTVHIAQADAIRALRGFDRLRGEDRARFQRMAARSYADLKKILSVIK